MLSDNLQEGMSTTTFEETLQEIHCPKCGLGRWVDPGPVKGKMVSRALWCEECKHTAWTATWLCSCSKKWQECHIHGRATSTTTTSPLKARVRTGNFHPPRVGFYRRFRLKRLRGTLASEKPGQGAVFKQSKSSDVGALGVIETHRQKHLKNQSQKPKTTKNQQIKPSVVHVPSRKRGMKPPISGNVQTATRRCHEQLFRERAAALSARTEGDLRALARRIRLPPSLSAYLSN